MYLLYFLPIVAIVGVVLYTRHAQKAVTSMTPEQARQKSHDFFAKHFDLQPGEMLWGTWGGLEYQGQKSTGRQVAGAVLNHISKNAIGVSTYVPSVFVGITSTRRVLISREFSRDGDRGHYKQIAALEPGTRAVGAETAYPDQTITPPLEATGPSTGRLVFARFVSPTGQHYDAWMSETGSFIATFNEADSHIPH